MFCVQLSDHRMDGLYIKHLFISLSLLFSSYPGIVNLNVVCTNSLLLMLKSVNNFLLCSIHCVSAFSRIFSLLRSRSQVSGLAFSLSFLTLTPGFTTVILQISTDNPEQFPLLRSLTPSNQERTILCGYI